MPRFSARDLALAILLQALVPLAGCQAPPPGRALVVTPVVAERALAAVIAPYTRTSIARLDLTLVSPPSGTGPALAARELSNAELGTPITFTNLRPYTAYRVRAVARGADGAAISVDDLSYVDLVVANDDVPAMGTLRVVLAGRPFDGRATAPGIAVTDGGLVPAGTETMGQALFVGREAP